MGVVWFTIQSKPFFRTKLLIAKPHEVKELLTELDISRGDMKRHLSEMLINIPGLSWDQLLYMPIPDVKMIVQVHNNKVKKQER